MEKSTSNSKGIDPMLILGKAVDMSVSMRGGDFSSQCYADEDSAHCT